MDIETEDAVRARMDSRHDFVERTCPILALDRITVAEDGVMFSSFKWRTPRATDAAADRKRRVREDCPQLVAQVIAECFA